MPAGKHQKMPNSSAPVTIRVESGLQYGSQTWCKSESGYGSASRWESGKKTESESGSRVKVKGPGLSQSRSRSRLESKSGTHVAY